MTGDQAQELDLDHLLVVFRKRVWLVVGLVVIASLTAFLVSRQAPNVYEAASKVRVTDPNSQQIFSDGIAVRDPKREVDTQIQLLQSTDIRAAVFAQLGDKATKVDSVSIQNVQDTDIIQITVSSKTPQIAAEAANTYAEVYVAKRGSALADTFNQKSAELRKTIDELTAELGPIESQLDLTPNDKTLIAQRDSLTKQAQDFRARATQYDVEAVTSSGNVEVINHANVPSTPVSPKPLRDAGLAAILALVLGVALVFLIERLDDRITNPEDLDRITQGVPLLGTIPIFQPDARRGSKKLPHGPRTLVPGNSVDAEIYRTLRSNIRFSNLAKTKSVLMITSASSGEGKSTVTSNLAVSLAESGQRVVVVSADLRRPVLAGIFDVEEGKKGLTSVLLGDSVITDCLVPITLDSGHKLYVLPAGPLPHNPAELLGTRAMGELLASLARADVDFVLVDCPPVLPVSDPLAIAQFVDGVILVSVVGQTKAHNLREALDRLGRVGADVIGVVLNGMPTARGRYASYYYRRYEGEGRYGTAYGANPAEPAKAEKAEKAPKEATTPSA